MSEQSEIDGLILGRDLTSAIFMVLLAHNHSMTAEAIAERIRIENSTDVPCSPADVLEWAKQKGYVNNKALILLNEEEELNHRSVIKGELFSSNWSQSFSYQRLAASAVFGIIQFLHTHPGHQTTAAISHLIEAGLNRKSFVIILHEIGKVANVANLPERLNITTWSEERISDLGRCMLALRHSSCLIGNEWWLFAYASKGERSHTYTLDKNVTALSNTTGEFPYDMWLQLRAPNREVFIPDARFAAPVFAHFRSLVLWNPRVTGYCTDEDERDGLRLLLTAQGIEHDLRIGDAQRTVPLPTAAGSALVTCPIDDAKALYYAKEFLRTASFPGHRRVFLICPRDCFNGEDTEWVEVRTELIKRDLLDCMFILPQEDADQSHLGMFILDNNKNNDAKGVVLLAGGVNTLILSNADNLPFGSTKDITQFAYRSLLRRLARDRENITGCSTIMITDVLLWINKCKLDPISTSYHPFSVISRFFTWDEFKYFRRIGDITDFSSKRTNTADESITSEDIIDALLTDFALPQYVRRELEQSYVAEQIKLFKHWSNLCFMDVFIRVPSIEAQQKDVDARNLSWGLLPLSVTESVTDTWIANLVDNIQLRKEDPDQCKENLGYIIRDLQRTERSRALADAEDAYKAYRHDLGNKTGRVRDSISLLKGQMQKPDAWTALAKDTFGRLENTLSTLDDYFDQMTGLLAGQEKCFTDEHYSISAVELSDVIEKVIESFEVPDVRFENRGNPVQVWADRQKLEQMLTNLAENAIRHGKLDGQSLHIIFVRMEENYDPDWAKPGFVTLLVANNGKPFDRNFDELTKPGVRSNRSKGEGLGLYMVRKWAVGMGGEMEMQTGYPNPGEYPHSPILPGFRIHIRKVMQNTST